MAGAWRVGHALACLEQVREAEGHKGADEAANADGERGDRTVLVLLRGQ